MAKKMYFVEEEEDVLYLPLKSKERVEKASETPTNQRPIENYPNSSSVYKIEKPKIQIGAQTKYTAPIIKTTNDTFPTRPVVNQDFGTHKSDLDWMEKHKTDQPLIKGNDTVTNLLKSGHNALVETGKGVFDYGERLLDAGLQLGSSEYNPFMHLLYDGEIKEGQAIARELIQENASQNFIDNTLGYGKKLSNGKTVQETLDENSLIKSDNIGGQVFRGIGNMLPSIMIANSGVGPAGTVGSYSSLGLNSYGGGLEEAYNDGANRQQANLYGIGNAGLEIGTEWITGGIPGTGGKTGLDNIVETGIDKISKQGLKEVTKAGYKMAGEGIEEMASEYFNPYLKEFIYTGSKNDSIGKKIANAHNNVDWNAVKQSGIVGSLSAGILDAPANIVNIKNGVSRQSQINSNNQKIAQLQEQQLNSTSKKQNSMINQQITQLQNQNDILTGKEPVNSKITNFRESAQKYLDDSIKSKNFQEIAEKLITEKGYNIILDSNITNENGNFVNAQIKSLENGEVEIRLNPNSAKAGEFLLIHEITHNIETDSIKNLILDYASKHDDFNQSLKALQKTYNTNDVSSEVIADISGELFGNQEFINNLSIEKSNIFKQIYNKIVELANRLTGNTHEALFVKDLKQKWEDAYRNTTTEQDVNSLNNTKYHVNVGISQNIDNVLSNIKERNPVKLRDYTPQILVDNGIKDLPMYENPSHIRKNILTIQEAQKLGLNVTPKDHYHGLGKELYIKAIDSLDNPRVIFKRNNSNDYLILTTIKNNNNNIVVPIEIETSTNVNNIKIDINRVKTVYGYDIKSPDLNDYIKYNLNKNEFVKIYEQKKERGTGNSTVASSHTDNISKSDNYVKSGILPKYSMQNDINNTYELDNSSFSLDENAKRYDDLMKTNSIEYFTKDNGSIRVNMIDTNNNLVNQIDIYSNTDAIKQLGEKLGDYIYSRSNYDNQIIRLGNDINNTGSDTDYFMNHRPTETGAYSSDISDNGNLMPVDVYEHPEWYFMMNTDYSKESFNVLKRIKNNPNAEVTIYRATPGNKINNGDWVTLSKLYAQYHNNSQFDGKGNILELKVKASDIQFAGDDINEFGYYPKAPKYSQNSNKWQQYLDNHYQKDGAKTYFEDIRLSKKNENSVLPKYHNDTETQTGQLPTYNKKVSDPIEISKLTKKDANTTPKLPSKKTIAGDGKSSFYENVTEKTQMLSEATRKKLKNQIDIQYYKKVTNQESLNTAFKKLNENGSSETLDWFNRNSYDTNGNFRNNPTSIDVAEGWILLKQYQDAGDYDSMVQIAKTMREIGTQAGQTVQAFNIMERLTPEGMVKYAQSELTEAYNKMIKDKSKKWIDNHALDFELTPTEVEFIIDHMKEVSTMKDGYTKKVKLAEIQKLMQDKLPAEKGQSLKSWMRISMLFNPKTQVRNVLGNALITPVNAVSDVISSGADKIISKYTGKRTTGLPNIKAVLKGMKRGAYESTMDYKKGINTKEMEGNRFELGQGKSFNDKTIIGKSLNQVDNLLGYMLDAGDRVFSESIFENSLQNQMILNNTTEITQEMIDIARTEALQKTWNDSNNYTSFVLDVRRGLNKIGIKGYGLGDVLIPFAKTPANLTKAIVDYSPAGLVTTLTEGNKLRKSLSNGQYNAQLQHKFVQSLGKATAGTMLYVLGYALAKTGVTSGKSDKDKDTANFLKNALGVNSYSIKIGGKSFTYDWAQPLAAPLSITANVVNSKNKETALLEAIVGSLDSGGSILLEQSFLQSINDVLSDNDGVVSGLINEVLELPSRAVPTLSKQVVDLTDSTQRTSYEYGKPIESAINSIKAKIPGLSKTLAPSVDTMGRELQRYGGKNNLFNVFLNPANVTNENISKSAEEIYKVYKSTGDKTIMPRVAPYYIDGKNEKKILSSKEKAEYQKISGNIIEKEVQRLVNNKEYKKLEDEEKATIIKSVVDYAYNKAREDVLDIVMPSEYNKLEKYLSNDGNVADYYLKKDEINYSLENPQRYNAMKAFNIEYDDYTKYMKKINELKDSNNETNSRKNAVFKYINSLNLSKNAKIALYGMSGYGISDYKQVMFDYINSLNLSKSEKEELYYYFYTKKGSE